MTEGEIQKAVFQHLRERGAPNIVFWHTPNDKSSRRKAGFRAGVCDVVVMRKREQYGLELKTKIGRPTLDELEFIDDFRRAGGHAMVAYGLDEALMYLKSWGLIR